ncbi:hypothetical protein Ancab_014871 [Ancistrocladus abbreviatus]
MGSLFSLLLILLSLPSPPLLLPSSSTAAAAALTPQVIKSTRLLDLLIRDYTFKLFNNNFKTGILHSVHLPANLSGIGVNTVRLRCGSLRRYGATIEEFHLGSGVTIHPCVERVVLIKQNLGHNWSNLYYQNFNLDGYRLISPILGLLAYNAGDDVNQSSNPFELGILAGENPIKIDFRNVTTKHSPYGQSSQKPYCASFESGGGAVAAASTGGIEGGGRVILANMVEPYVCLATKQGHFGLVVKVAEEGVVPAVEEDYKKTEESRWKVAVGSSIGAALGAFLLGLLLIAIFVRKKRTKMEEMVRRAYEEEALQVSMVGHVRAPTAPVTRTLPTTIEHHYRPLPL